MGPVNSSDQMNSADSLPVESGLACITRHQTMMITAGTVETLASGRPAWARGVSKKPLNILLLTADQYRSGVVVEVGVGPAEFAIGVVAKVIANGCGR